MKTINEFFDDRDSRSPAAQIELDNAGIAKQLARPTTKRNQSSFSRYIPQGDTIEHTIDGCSYALAIINCINGGVYLVLRGNQSLECTSLAGFDCVDDAMQSPIWVHADSLNIN